MTIDQSYDYATLKSVFGAYPTGVAALAAIVGGRPVGLTLNSFTSVSLDPPIAGVCMAHSSSTWPLLKTAERLGVSVLSREQEQASRQLSAREGDRFADLEWRSNRDGAVFLNEASAFFECSIHGEMAAGDHDVVLLAIHDLGFNPEVQPLVFHRSQYWRLDAREAS